jgi:hypothetical protein
LAKILKFKKPQTQKLMQKPIEKKLQKLHKHEIIISKLLSLHKVKTNRTKLNILNRGTLDSQMHQSN